jgi:hypothetical protein
MPGPTKGAKRTSAGAKPAGRSGPATGRGAGLPCWERKGCGREAGGTRAAELGVCPAYPDHGRDCWMKAGTLCGGEVQGTYAEKLGNCLQCEFYDRVMSGEW